MKNEMQMQYAMQKTELEENENEKINKKMMTNEPINAL